jgi:hypothetical protein
MHIGKLIRHYAKDKGLKVENLAKSLNLSVDAVYKIFKTPDLKTGKVVILSNILQHDFFEHCQEQVENNIYQRYHQLKLDHQKLQKEHEYLLMENQLLKQIFNVPGPK